MSGTSTGYAVDLAGEYIDGVVLARGMRVRRGGERLVFGPRDVRAWDPSTAHRGVPRGGTHWTARLVILESPTLDPMLQGGDPLATDFSFSEPLMRDVRLARRFVELHRALETRSWAPEREVLLADWLYHLTGGERGLVEACRARQDPALRRGSPRSRAMSVAVARRRFGGTDIAAAGRRRTRPGTGVSRCTG